MDAALSRAGARRSGHDDALRGDGSEVRRAAVNSRLIVDVLRTRRQHRRREHWTRDELDVFQRRALAELRSFAVEHSSFYRRIHRGLESRPLEDLPLVTKHDLM